MTLGRAVFFALVLGAGCASPLTVAERRDAQAPPSGSDDAEAPIFGPEAATAPFDAGDEPVPVSDPIDAGPDAD